MKLRYEEVGTGDRKVVCLHGFLGSGRNLFSLARAWSERDPRCKLLLVDLPGHGQSPPLPVSASLFDVGDAVLAWWRSHSDQPMEIVGHSLGGRVALAMAIAHPDSCASIALLDIAPGPLEVKGVVDAVVHALLSVPERAPSRAEMKAQLLEQGAPASLADWLLMNFSRTDGSYAWRFDRESLARFRDSTDREDLWPAVERPGSPVKMCIRGAKSGYVTDEDVARMERAGCRVATLPSAGHFVHVDDPDGVLDGLTAADRLT